MWFHIQADGIDCLNAALGVYKWKGYHGKKPGNLQEHQIVHVFTYFLIIENKTRRLKEGSVFTFFSANLMRLIRIIRIRRKNFFGGARSSKTYLRGRGFSYIKYTEKWFLKMNFQSSSNYKIEQENSLSVKDLFFCPKVGSASFPLLNFNTVLILLWLFWCTKTRIMCWK